MQTQTTAQINHGPLERGQETDKWTEGAPASATKAPLFTEQPVTDGQGVVCGGRNRGPRSERRNSMLPLEKEREKGKRTRASKERRVNLHPPFFLFLILFSRGGKWQVSILGSKRS